MKKISTAHADVILEKENFIRIEIYEKAELDLAAIKEINKAKRSLIGNKFHTVLFIPGLQASISREAREFSASKEVVKNAIAKAILAKNFSHRLIGNFFLKINKPAHPTSIFSTETDAVQWLQKMTLIAMKKKSLYLFNFL